MATTTSPASNITLLPAVVEDIPTLAAISHAAFLSDTHTRLKALLAGYNHGEGSKEGLQSWISHPRCAIIKAVTSEGEIVGSVCWNFKGFEWDGQMPSSTTEMKVNEGSKEERASITTLPPPPQIPVEETQGETKIQQLAQLSGGAMSHYSTLLTPPDSKCVILMGINVLPTHQSLGIGSRLIAFGTSIADSQGVYSWVSSSDKGYRAFEKAGYREVGRLQLDLDDFAFDEEGKRVDDPESEDGKWGEYVWRYMKREVGGV